MIRITIELVKWGWDSKENTLVIGKAEIHNTLTGTEQIGNYGYTLAGKKNRILTQGYVNGFPRLSKNVWHLLRKVLDDALGDGDG